MKPYEEFHRRIKQKNTSTMVLMRLTSTLSSVVDDSVTCLCLHGGDGDGVYGPGYEGGGRRPQCGCRRLWRGVDACSGVDVLVV